MRGSVRWLDACQPLASGSAIVRGAMVKVWSTLSVGVNHATDASPRVGTPWMAVAQCSNIVLPISDGEPRYAPESRWRADSKEGAKQTSRPMRFWNSKAMLAIGKSALLREFLLSCSSTCPEHSAEDRCRMSL
jgi:hypothetical protein